MSMADGHLSASRVLQDALCQQLGLGPRGDSKMILTLLADMQSPLEALSITLASKKLQLLPFHLALIRGAVASVLSALLKVDPQVVKIPILRTSVLCFEEWKETRLPSVQLSFDAWMPSHPDNGEGDSKSKSKGKSKGSGKGASEELEAQLEAVGPPPFPPPFRPQAESVRSQTRGCFNLPAGTDSIPPAHLAVLSGVSPRLVKEIIQLHPEGVTDSSSVGFPLLTCLLLCWPRFQAEAWVDLMLFVLTEHEKLAEVAASADLDLFASALEVCIMQLPEGPRIRDASLKLLTRLAAACPSEFARCCYMLGAAGLSLPQASAVEKLVDTLTTSRTLFEKLTARQWSEAEDIEQRLRDEPLVARVWIKGELLLWWSLYFAAPSGIVYTLLDLWPEAVACRKRSVEVLHLALLRGYPQGLIAQLLVHGPHQTKTAVDLLLFQGHFGKLSLVGSTCLQLALQVNCKAETVELLVKHSAEQLEGSSITSEASPVILALGMRGLSENLLWQLLGRQRHNFAALLMRLADEGNGIISSVPDENFKVLLELDHNKQLGAVKLARDCGALACELSKGPNANASEVARMLRDGGEVVAKTHIKGKLPATLAVSSGAPVEVVLRLLHAYPEAAVYGTDGQYLIHTTLQRLTLAFKEQSDTHHLVHYTEAACPVFSLHAEFDVAWSSSRLFSKIGDLLQSKQLLQPLSMLHLAHAVFDMAPEAWNASAESKAEACLSDIFELSPEVIGCLTQLLVKLLAAYPTTSTVPDSCPVRLLSKALKNFTPVIVVHALIERAPAGLSCLELFGDCVKSAMKLYKGHNLSRQQRQYGDGWDGWGQYSDPWAAADPWTSTSRREKQYQQQYQDRLVYFLPARDWARERLIWAGHRQCQVEGDVAAGVFAHLPEVVVRRVCGFLGLPSVARRLWEAASTSVASGASSTVTDVQQVGLHAVQLVLSDVNSPLDVVFLRDVFRHFPNAAEKPVELCEKSRSSDAPIRCLPLHAALLNRGSGGGLSLAMYLLELYPLAATVEDSLGRLPLALALSHPAPWHSLETLVEALTIQTPEAQADIVESEGSDHQAQTTSQKGNGKGLREALRQKIAGAAVQRGPDWEYGSEDESYWQGTTLDEPVGKGWIRVQWRGGGKKYYRIGAQGRFDLSLLDRSTWHRGPVSALESASPPRQLNPKHLLKLLVASPQKKALQGVGWTPLLAGLQNSAVPTSRLLALLAKRPQDLQRPCRGVSALELALRRPDVHALVPQLLAVLPELPSVPLSDAAFLEVACRSRAPLALAKHLGVQGSVLDLLEASSLDGFGASSSGAEETLQTTFLPTRGSEDFDHDNDGDYYEDSSHYEEYYGHDREYYSDHSVDY